MFLATIEANLALDALVTAGGSWYVSLSTTVPDKYLTSGITEPPGQTRAQLQRISSWWDPAADRSVQAVSDLILPPPTLDLGVAVFWVGWDSLTAGIPRVGGKLAGGNPILAGSGNYIPKQFLRIDSF